MRSFFNVKDGNSITRDREGTELADPLFSPMKA